MSNFNFNKVILGGRLTAEPELRQTPQGIPVVSFTVAVNRRMSKNAQERQADFINCVAWRASAEFISRYFHKGSPICVVGNIQTRSWTDQQGQKRYATDVVVEEATFVDSAADNRAGGAPQPYNPYMGAASDPVGAAGGAATGTPAFTSSTEEAPKFEEMINDDDLPF